MTTAERLERELPLHPDWSASDWAQHLKVTRVRIHQIKWARGLNIPHADPVALRAARHAGSEISTLGLSKKTAPRLYERIRRRHLRRLRKAQQDGHRQRTKR